jgi:hypothetical protein
VNHYRAEIVRCQLEFLCSYTELAMKPKRSIIRMATEIGSR